MPGRIPAWLIATLKRGARSNATTTRKTATRSWHVGAPARRCEHQRSGGGIQSVISDCLDLDVPTFLQSV